MLEYLRANWCVLHDSSPRVLCEHASGSARSVQVAAGRKPSLSRRVPSSRCGCSAKSAASSSATSSSAEVTYLARGKIEFVFFSGCRDADVLRVCNKLVGQQSVPSRPRAAPWPGGGREELRRREVLAVEARAPLGDVARERVVAAQQRHLKGSPRLALATACGDFCVATAASRNYLEAAKLEIYVIIGLSH